MEERGLLASVYQPPRARRAWRFEEVLGHDRLRYFSLGRWALKEALRLAGAEPGTAVLLPGYLCREVVASVAVLGARPVYYGLTPTLEPAAHPRDWPQACAVVAVNFFGFAQDLAPFEEYCRRTGALLIEDNCHGLFSRNGQGRALGCRAPLGIFSLRKSMPLPDGGALAVNDPALWGQAAGQLPFTPRPAGKRRWLRELAPIVGAKGAWSAIRLGRRLRALKAGQELPPPDPEGEARIPGTPEPCAELGGPQLCVEPQAETERRRALYAFCADLLAGCGVTPVFPNLPEHATPYLFPYHAAGEAADKAESKLNACGLFSLPWPDLPVEVAAAAPQHYKDIRGAHFLW